MYFSKLLEQVEKVAKLVPTKAFDSELSRQAIQKIKELNHRHTLGGLDWKKLRDKGPRHWRNN